MHEGAESTGKAAHVEIVFNLFLCLSPCFFCHCVRKGDKKGTSATTQTWGSVLYSKLITEDEINVFTTTSNLNVGVLDVTGNSANED